MNKFQFSIFKFQISTQTAWFRLGEASPGLVPVRLGEEIFEAWARSSAQMNQRRETPKASFETEGNRCPAIFSHNVARHR